MAAPDEPAASPTPAEEGISPAPAVEGVQDEAAPIPLPPPPEPAPDSPARYLRWRGILDGALVAVVLLLAFEIGLFPVRNSEVLMHRAVGRLVAQGNFDFQGGTDPFTFTTAGVRWVNHSWLYGLFVYGMHQMGESGDVALVVLKALLLAALAEVMLRLGRRPGRGLWMPGLCTGLAVLAMSPRAFLNPGCVSYLFLGLTLYLLDAPRRRQAEPGSAPPRWNLRWLIPPLCVLWVNLDAWFLLGPAVVALYLIGEVLEGPSAPAGGKANLLAVLGASVAACLVSPYHVFGFTLPDQLGLSPAGEILSGEAARNTAFPQLFVSPFRNAFFDVGVNRGLAGLAYFPLVFAGLASFILAPGAWRNWRGPVWLAFFLLSAWHARAIPFFAVVAGPITALNVLDLTVASEADAPGAADRRRRMLSLRVLTLLTGIAALAAGSAGWLHAPVWGADQVVDSRRPGWWTEFDGTLVKAAQQVHDWQEGKKFPGDVHLFNSAPNAGAYLAWYAPGARVFIDDRLSLYPADVARDYLDARKTIANPTPRPAAGETAEAAGDWASVFDARKISYLLIAEGDLSRRQPAVLSRLLLQPEDWTLCYLYGGSAVFGWNGRDGHKSGDYAAIRYNSDRLAFGPGAEKAPRKRLPPPAEPEWWEAIWQAEPPRSADIDNALIHVVAFEARSSLKAENDARASWVRRIPLAAGAGGPLANGTLVNMFVLGSYREPPPPPSDLYLAVRAARRALELNPEDGRAWFRLGQAYSDLFYNTREALPAFASPITREVRQTQLIAALTRAVRWNPELEPAHALLAEQFHNRFLDLELRHREAQLKALTAEVAALGARGENEFVAREKQRLAFVESEVKRLTPGVKERGDQFELEAAKMPPAQRVQLAVRYGLGDAALKAARDGVQTGEQADPGARAAGLEMAVRLLINMGEIDEARVVLDGGAETINLVTNPNLPVPPRATGEWYHLLVDAAAGDYEKADETLAELLKRGGGPDATLRNVTAMLAIGLGDDLLLQSLMAGRADGLTARWVRMVRQNSRTALPDGVVTLQQAVQGGRIELARQADLQTLRGWLALEEGQIDTAKQELSAVTKRVASAQGIFAAYRSKALAEVLLEWIKANDHP
jgi:tetratricopeptide (TPR) repeat protein